MASSASAPALARGKPDRLLASGQIETLEHQGRDVAVFSEHSNPTRSVTLTCRRIRDCPGARLPTRPASHPSRRRPCHRRPALVQPRDRLQRLQQRLLHCPHRSLSIRAISFRNTPNIAFRQYFGAMTTWYLQYHRTWDCLCHSLILDFPLEPRGVRGRIYLHGTPQFPGTVEPFRIAPAKPVAYIMELHSPAMRPFSLLEDERKSCASWIYFFHQSP